MTGPDGRVYCIPCAAEGVLVIDPMTDTAVEKYGAIISQHMVDTGLGRAERFKWYGGACAADGKIYCAPYNAISVLVIDPRCVVDCLGLGWFHSQPARIGAHRC